MLCSLSRSAGYLLLLLIPACASLTVQEDLSAYQADVERLEEHLQDHPDDADALRELGIIYTRTGHFAEARPLLERAYAQDRDDAATMLYYGLALEGEGDRSAALQVYSRYRELPATSRHRRRMAGRYHLLVRTGVREELRERLAREAELDDAAPTKLAVVPFVYQGIQDRYAPLGRGLGEMLSNDLSQIDRLTVLERVRLQALLDELALSRGDVVDPATAPRVGRLLGAGRLVGGSYDVLEGDVLRIDAAAWEPDAERAPAFDSRSDALNNLFVLEKDLVFAILREFGIEPSPEEREAIERVPTRNLQAFLAYSRGLMEEDAGRFDAAARQFRRAASLDPGFSQAADQAEAMEGLAATSPSAQDAAMELGGTPSAAQDDLLSSRQQNLGSSVGSVYLPGDDTRDTPVEETNALPVPPRPPPRDN